VDLCNDIIIDIIHCYFGAPVTDDNKQTMIGILGDLAAFILVGKPPMLPSARTDPMRA